MESPESGGLLLVFGAGRQDGGPRWLVRHTGSAMGCSVVECSVEFAHYCCIPFGRCLSDTASYNRGLAWPVVEGT